MIGEPACRVGTIVVYLNSGHDPIEIPNVHRIMLKCTLENPVVTFEDIERLIKDRTAKCVSALPDSLPLMKPMLDDIQNRTGPDPWKHRSSGMRCRTCMWCALKNADVGVSLEESRGKQIGRCRRHAPTMNGYPVVFMDDWCGDHKLDENKAGA